MASKPDPDLMKAGPAAEYLGISQAALSGAFKRGSIQRAQNRPILYSRAELDRYAASRPHSGGKDLSNAPVEKKKDRKPHLGREPNPMDEDGQSLASKGEGGGAAAKLARAKAEREVHNAELARIKVEQASGELVPRADVEATLALIATTLKTKMLNWKPSFMPYVGDAGKPIIEKSIRDLLEEIQEDLRRVVDE